MLFDEFDERKLNYYFLKFGKGDFVGPHYMVKKGKKIKIKGNHESVYDFPFYFISLSKNNKVKGSFFVPKDLNYETNLEIEKEKVKERYREIKVKGEGYFKADYFFFIGDVENEYGKLKTKKPKMTEETDKKYFNFLKADLVKDSFFPEEKNVEYKVSFTIDLEIKKDNGIKVIRKIKGIKKVNNDEEKFELELEEKKN